MRKSNNELGDAVLVNDIRIAYVNDDQEEYSSLSLPVRNG